MAEGGYGYKKSNGKGKDGKGKGKDNGDRGKGRNRGDSDGYDRRSSRTNPFEGKEYDAKIKELLDATEARASDFEARDVELLDDLFKKGKIDEAIKALQDSLKGRERKSIANWKNYIHSLLRKVNPEGYAEQKSAQLTRKNSEVSSPKGTSISLASSLPARRDTLTKLNAEASEFKPGEKIHVTVTEKDEDKGKSKGKEKKNEKKSEEKPKEKEPEPGFLECCFRRAD
eukprot:TRINITY_DN4197_c0_g1_i2.p1 TRINITY_DN4197_c0_g1~~TRINITY_DN4197_c0_g1_i2.p1  ORF type:complete len:228 (+),score=73.06 TRINITY_DN4197_c0_g1_i2:139-822(+)